MSLVLTGRDEARWNEAADQIRRASGVSVETVVADLSTQAGVSALLHHVGGRPIEVLVNNAGFGSYGPFAEGDSDREAEEVAVDVGAVITLARAFLPGMLARGSGGILNVASTIAFQPAPYQALYGVSKGFVLSFSQALWAEARAPAGRHRALPWPHPHRLRRCDGRRRSGHTAIYSRLGDPSPSSRPGCGRWTRAEAVVIPGVRSVNQRLSSGPAAMPVRAAGRRSPERVSARRSAPAACARYDCRGSRCTRGAVGAGGEPWAG